MTLKRLVCLAAATAWPQVAVSDVSQRTYVTKVWSRFVEVCTPFVQDLPKFKAELLTGSETDEVFVSKDRMIVDALRDTGSEDQAIGFVIEQFSERIDGHCTVEDYTASTFGTPQTLATTFEGLVAETPQLSAKGGQIFALGEQYNDSERGFQYLVDGVFSDRAAYLYVVIHDEVLAFDLHVDYRLDGAGK